MRGIQRGERYDRLPPMPDDDLCEGLEKKRDVLVLRLSN